MILEMLLDHAKEGNDTIGGSIVASHSWWERILELHCRYRSTTITVSQRKDTISLQYYALIKGMKGMMECLLYRDYLVTDERGFCEFMSLYDRCLNAMVHQVKDTITLLDYINK